jgi:hypothetical protein
MDSSSSTLGSTESGRGCIRVEYSACVKSVNIKPLKVDLLWRDRDLHLDLNVNIRLSKEIWVRCCPVVQHLFLLAVIL